MCQSATVALMAFVAYGLKNYQIVGAINDDKEKYDVQAKVPNGSTKAEVKLMMQTLLAERFKLVFHYEKKDMGIYELTVAKSGLKMKESLDNGPVAPAVGQNVIDSDGFLLRPIPGILNYPRANGLMRLMGTSISMEYLTSTLGDFLKDPVLDATKLPGKYDLKTTFTLESIGETSPGNDAVGGVTLVVALERDLGLRLGRKKGAIDLFVIDHYDKSAGEN